MIRTRDLYVPNVALYQAEPHSVFCNYGKGIRTPTNRVRVCCATITPFRNVLCSLANKYYYTYISKNCKHFFKFFLFLKMSTLNSTFFHVFIVLLFCTIRNLFYCIFSLLDSAIVRLPLLPASHAPYFRSYASCFTSSSNSSPAE